jgi:hypothetical protein
MGVWDSNSNHVHLGQAEEGSNVSSSGNKEPKSNENKLGADVNEQSSSSSTSGEEL